MDLVDMMAAYDYLGKEFLVWLWYTSEIKSVVELTNVDVDDKVVISFDRNIALSDENSKVVWAGDTDSGGGLTEAREGLRSGKLVEKANVEFILGDLQFSTTIVGSTLDLTAIKLPRTVEIESSDEAGKHGCLYDRALMFQLLNDVVVSLFKTFVFIRLQPDLWRMERMLIEVWVREMGVDAHE